jgi:outer membrane protein OmpA-like peptidoglycan-associated protein
MRLLPLLSAVLLTAATPAFAQVTVDLHALQALPDHPAPADRQGEYQASAEHQASRASHLPRAEPASITPNRPTVATREAPAASPPAASPPAASPPAASPPAASLGAPPATKPVIPESVPATASIAPVTPQAPPPGAQPPPPPPVSDKSTTAAAPISSGLRLIFAPGGSDLSEESSASIKQLTQSAPPGDATTFNVLAYAPGKADDPSTARRISLSRAMSVRSALVADGVPSARIFVRALGERFGDGPADRVDLSVTGSNVPTDTATSR